MLSPIPNRIRFSLITILLVTITLEPTRAQQAAGPVHRTPEHTDRRIMVQSVDDSITIGLLVGIRGDTLIVFAKGRQQSIPFESLLKMTLARERKTGAVVPGMLLGAYLGGMWLLRAENQPTAFVSTVELDVMLIYTPPFFVAGGGLLTYMRTFFGEKDEYVFDFVRSGREHEQELERLRQIVTGVRRSRKVHFSVQGGRVFTQVASRYESLFTKAGYTGNVGGGVYLDDYSIVPASNVNLLRKLQLTYSLTREIGIGAALAWLSEPSALGVSDYAGGDYVRIRQSLEVPAYFAVVKYTLPSPRAAPKSALHVGLGLGTAEIDFRLKAKRELSFISGPNDPNYIDKDYVEVDGNVTTSRFSGMVFCEWRFPLTDWFSVGLIGDYFYIPRIKVPGLQDFDIPAQTLSLGNGSIGFQLGFSF